MNTNTNLSKKGEIAKDILLAIGLSGLLVMTLALPGLAVALKPFMKRRQYSRAQITRSLNGLKKNKTIILGQRGDKIVAELTKEGLKKIQEYKLEELKIKKQRRWDHKWRIVIFDIPESLKSYRLAFSTKLKELGFILVQKSVWLNPYPCEEEIRLLTNFYNINRFVRVILAENIDDQPPLLKHFKL
jgi:DNA-binding transcriptional regulator PaaX